MRKCEKILIFLVINKVVGKFGKDSFMKFGQSDLKYGYKIIGRELEVCILDMKKIRKDRVRIRVECNVLLEGLIKRILKGEKLKQEKE